MPHDLKYGIDRSVRLDVPEASLVAVCGTARGEPLTNPAAAVAAALADPIGFPPLAQATTPGDRVVLAVDPALPQSGAVAAGVVESLLVAGVQPDGIAVLRTGRDATLGRADPRPWLNPDVASRLAVLDHHPEQRRELAYLAANRRDEPILLNRAIADADVLLPIGCWRRRGLIGFHGLFGTLYPTFADHLTQARFHREYCRGLRPKLRRELTDEADQVGWLLGVSLVVEAIPGPGESLLGVLAGEPASLAKAARTSYRSTWGDSAGGAARLVVATIEGGDEHQTWANLGHVLDAAGRLMDEGGAVAVCSTLSEPPGPTLRRLAGSRAPRRTLSQISREPPDDALPAIQLARALRRGRVYLLSDLDRTVVEDLDIAPLGDAAELSRLAARSGSCTLLANALLARVRLEVTP